MGIVLKGGLTIKIKVFVIVFFLCSVFLLISFINHQVQLKKEVTLINPQGEMVEVNGHNMHIYSEGEGDMTLVFMAGSGIAAPELEFKGLYSELSNDYRIAVVDRAGYGYSDVSKDSRDIDTILEETRETLKLAGEKGPYVLFPHSISALEAIYWAQKYPEEIKGIVGLDIGLPNEYVNQKLRGLHLFIVDLQSFLVKVGVHRFVPSITFDKKVIDSDFLTKEEKEIFKALSYKNVLNQNMIDELKSAKINAEKSRALPFPTKTPIVIFSAFPYTDEEAKKQSITLDEWDDHYHRYVSQFDIGDVISVHGEHSIYLYEPEMIAEKSKVFIQNLNSKSE